MITFSDFYNNKVQLSFQDHPFSKDPKHVLVICRHRGKWLLTKHKERGLEFPGGKVEPGEIANDAAVREVMEETGGVVTKLHYIGQYFVDGKKDYVIKNLYFAEVNELKEQPTYYETDGPVLLLEIPENVRFNSSYSFIMKDRIIEHGIGYITKNF
ncbi:RNA deprotection pyrophosphohydrolase [Oceanobacillus alkalisoli]|uniref:RNA deprotection pyrophosphohydrolase n=1 Tax=Oceanobacillus alkalisoli TaxID=2925113 RepID=UPI001EF02C08|nr:nucleoside triphosphatase YtkD [Oceanobacillus alkalisoli]MCF3943489.1 nucleoside triphosphatase YtkD [Oceanobacillus alkalisoli]MCG5104077.1 nucleoside triphosphatase YtkD [Oceanobacillus alkalisoli]